MSSSLQYISVNIYTIFFFFIKKYFFLFLIHDESKAHGQSKNGIGASFWTCIGIGILLIRT